MVSLLWVKEILHEIDTITRADFMGNKCYFYELISGLFDAELLVW